MSELAESTAVEIPQPRKRELVPEAANSVANTGINKKLHVERGHAQSAILEPYTRYKPIRQDFCVVDSNVNLPVRLYYELYGTGDTKVLFVMGFQTTAMSWEEQIEFFSKKPEYQVCIFDNRGIGRSDAPRGLYSTTQMAKDAIQLIAAVGWQPENVNVVGVSMGGMIAQEIGWLATHGIKSLCLTSTHAGRALTPLSSIVLFLSAILNKDARKKVDVVFRLLFPIEWGDVEAGDGSGRTNYDAFKETYFQRSEVAARSSIAGVVGQLGAVWRHHMSKARLRLLGNRGFPIKIVTGDQDRLVLPRQSTYLAEQICCPLEVFQGVGHAPGAQCKTRYNTMLLQFFKEAELRLPAD